MTRRRRWMLRLLLGFVGLLLVLVVGAFLVLANLDAGPIKSFVRGKARAQGIDLDYDQAGAGWGGAHLAGVRVLSPPADAALAPELVRIGSIDARWSPLARRLD